MVADFTIFKLITRILIQRAFELPVSQRKVEIRSIADKLKLTIDIEAGDAMKHYENWYA